MKLIVSSILMVYAILKPTQDSSNCLIKDEKTAVKIAQLIWKPLYGQKIKHFKPFKARFYDSIWIVSSEKMKGGPYIEINCEDLKVLKVEYGK